MTSQTDWNETVACPTCGDTERARLMFVANETIQAEFLKPSENGAVRNQITKRRGDVIVKVFACFKCRGKLVVTPQA